MEVDLQAIDQDLKKIPFTEPKPVVPDERKPEGKFENVILVPRSSSN